MYIEDLEDGEHPVSIIHRECVSALFAEAGERWSVIGALTDGRRLAFECPEGKLTSDADLVIYKVGKIVYFSNPAQIT